MGCIKWNGGNCTVGQQVGAKGAKEQAEPNRVRSSSLNSKATYIITIKFKKDRVEQA